ncbi:Tyrosine-protein phosphatase non-receptor type 23 [Blomia tropicalis]|nr:Tyrosine-protein phosphatase non-receptor type 23 [Blomia tropicalis]
MEAVPKLPMLSFELKISPVCPDFAAPFKRFIVKYYGEDGDLYDREIMDLETLRNSACRTVRDFTGCSVLKRYYAQIYSLFNRFVVFESQIGVQCVWADIYTGQTNIGDLEFELACILYNIGALHAELGANDSRQTAEEMKVSCTHFQCAAWAFQQLMRDPKLFRSNDLSNDVLTFFVQIMLAQAQECILEKSMLDNRKANIVAKVAAQVVEYYKIAIAMLQQGDAASTIIEVVGTKLFKEWKKFVEFKLGYYGAICHLYMGNFCEEQQKMGERVSWYESADAKMKDVTKLAKQLDSHLDVGEAIIFVADVITVKLNNAKKENDFIYHEKVIPIEQLSEIKGASLVKGIPFSITDPEIFGHDIFARLVPIEAHETASLYSAQKDEILRQIRRKIEDRNQELVSYLSSIQLDKNSLRNPKEDAIPDELIDICAELSLNPDAVDLVEKTLSQLDAICEEADKTITESKNLLNEEEEKEKAFQEKFGKRPPSLILVDLSKELTKHEATHNKALQSNRSLWENFDQHKDDIRIMTSSSASKIASILPSNKDVNFSDDTVIEMERLFDKVEEMKKQRLMLEEKLIKEMDSDNVLKLVLAHPKSEIESVFGEEIKKYDKIVRLIEQNLTAQDNILRALTDCNARYADTRKAIIEAQRNRKTRVASLMYTYQVFKELQNNSKKGLEFYDKFQVIVTRLGARIRGVSKVQDEERTQFVNAQTKKMTPIVPGIVNQSPGIGLGPYPLTAAPVVANLPPSQPKLKDFLPFMNQNKNPAIPVANYMATTTVSYSLPAIISTVTPITPAVASPLCSQPSQYQPYSQVNQQPISSVLPIQQPQQQPNLPSTSQPAMFSNASAYGTTNYQTNPIVARTNVPMPGYGNQYYGGGQMNQTPQPTVSSMGNSYFYPAPVIGANSQPNIAPVVPVASNATSAYTNQIPSQPQHVHIPPSSQYLPSSVNNMYQHQYPQTTMTTTSQQPQTTYNYGQTAVNPTGAYIHSQQIAPQPQVPSYGGGGGQTRSQPVAYQIPNGNSYIQQPVAPAIQPMPNSVAATIQAIETESKGGWPVLTPIKPATTLSSSTSVLPSVSSFVPNSTTSNGSVESNADHLPDILSTMSITTNGNQTSTMVAVSSTNLNDNLSKTLSSSTTAGNVTENGITTNNEQSEQIGGESKELLSQFDPLFS